MNNMYYCVLCMYFLCLLSGCQKQEQLTPRISHLDLDENKNQISQLEYEHIVSIKQLSDADLTLELSSWNCAVIKLGEEDNQKLQGDNFEGLIDDCMRVARLEKKELAVVIIPSEYPIVPSEPIAEEYMKVIEKQMYDNGFEQVAFQSILHGLRYRVYPTGLPSESEIAEKKVSLERAASRIQEHSEPDRLGAGLNGLLPK